MFKPLASVAVKLLETQEKLDSRSDARRAEKEAKQLKRAEEKAATEAKLQELLAARKA